MKPHRTDFISLLFGLLFTVTAVLGLFDALDLSGATLRWGGAVLLVVFGVALMATSRPRGGADTRDIS